MEDSRLPILGIFVATFALAFFCLRSPEIETHPQLLDYSAQTLRTVAQSRLAINLNEKSPLIIHRSETLLLSFKKPIPVDKILLDVPGHVPLRIDASISDVDFLPFKVLPDTGDNARQIREVHPINKFGAIKTLKIQPLSNNPVIGIYGVQIVPRPIFDIDKFLLFFPLLITLSLICRYFLRPMAAGYTTQLSNSVFLIGTCFFAFSNYWIPCVAALGLTYLYSLETNSSKAFRVFPAFLFGTTTFYWFTSQLPERIFRSGFLNGVFDALATSLLVGNASVPAESILHEEFIVGGRTYTYFGLLPALIRVIPNLFFPRHLGHWAGISMYIGACLALLAFALIAELHLVEREELPNSRLINLMIITFSISSPLLYYLSCQHVFHEANIWALACSLFGLYFYLRLDAPAGTTALRSYLLFSLACGTSLLTRPTYALPLILLLLLRMSSIFFGYARKPRESLSYKLRARRLLSLALPLLPFAALQCWYNQARFGSIFTFIDMTKYLNFIKNPSEMQHFLNIGQFDIARLGSTAPLYFSVSTDYLSTSFPFLLYQPTTYMRPELFLWYKEWTLPLSMQYPWLILASLAGLLSLIRHPCLKSTKVLLTLAALSIQPILILTYLFVTQRYAGEFVPVLVYLSSLWLKEQSARPASRKIGACIYGIATSSIILAILAQISWLVSFNTWADSGFRELFSQIHSVLE